jgi:aspartyl/asparaginyl beta-hydroxylase (cupin superfamily)
MEESQIDFTCALVERLLAEESLNLSGAALVEAGMRIGRLQDIRPPNPLQQPLHYYPGLTAKPWHDPRDFDWTERLEAAFEVIRSEVLEIHRKGLFSLNPLSDDFALSGAWNQYRLFNKGKKYAENCAHCPQTAKMVESIPGATSAGSVYFAALTPGAHLRAHWGPHNARLRCHLGIVVPQGCEIRVGTETGTWQEGKVIIFDDSFEHELWNRSDTTRIVLILDIWHPDLTPSDIVAIRYSDLQFVQLAYQVAQEWVTTGRIPRLAKPDLEVPQEVGAQTSG